MSGFPLHGRCLRGDARYRGLCGAGKAVWVRVWKVWFVWGACYLQVFVFAGNLVGFREDVSEALTFRRRRRGVGPGCRVGGQDWAWWSEKTPKLIDLVVVVQR